MTDNAPPSTNPANTDSLAGTMQVVLDKFSQKFDTMLPAEILSFDRETNRATVRPLIMVVKTDSNTMTRAEISNVPVFQISGGGFVINFPLKKGDFGWLHANDRDISLFKQSFQSIAPNTFRKHSFEDGVFYPDVMRGWTVEDDGLVIQTLSGNQKINILDDKIRIVSDAEIVLDSPLTTITGELRTGTGGGALATFGGPIVATGDITTLAGNISLGTHRHDNVEPGSGNSGGPIT